MAEAAEAAGEVMWRSRVGLCDDAARQGAVPPRFHTPMMLHCAPLLFALEYGTNRVYNMSTIGVAQVASPDHCREQRWRRV